MNANTQQVVQFQPAVETYGSKSLTTRERKTAWQRQQRRAFKAAHGYSTTAHYGAGGNRERILSRDGYACVKCGMTDEQHKAKWGRPITIDHISKDRSDNRDANLQTLCLVCHGRKDLIARLRVRKATVTVPRMQQMRKGGATYRAIAKAANVSIARVWNQLNKGQK